MSWAWSRYEVRTASRLCEAIFPSGVVDRLSLGAADTGISGFLPRLVAALPHQSALLLRAAVWLVLLIPPLFGFGLRTFNGLAASAREEVVSRLANHRVYLLREVFMMWKAYAGMGYGGDPRVRRMIGIGVPPEEAASPAPEAEPVAIGRGERR